MPKKLDLTRDQMTEFITARETTGKCPFCENDHWYAPPGQWPEKFLSIQQGISQMFTLICGNCGYQRAHWDLPLLLEGLKSEGVEVDNE